MIAPHDVDRNWKLLPGCAFAGDGPRLMGESRMVDLPLMAPCTNLGKSRGLWFLTSGVASFTFTSVRGTTIELATLGKEGVFDRLYVSQGPAGTA